jgi:hypothetical protein
MKMSSMGNTLGNRNIEKVILPPSLSQGWCCRILTHFSHLPWERESQICPAMDVYQAWNDRTSPTGHPSPVTCCLNDLVYCASLWWTHRRHKCLSHMQDESPGENISSVDKVRNTTMRGCRFPQVELHQK